MTNPKIGWIWNQEDPDSPVMGIFETDGSMSEAELQVLWDWFISVRTAQQEVYDENGKVETPETRYAVMCEEHSDFTVFRQWLLDMTGKKIYEVEAVCVINAYY